MAIAVPGPRLMRRTGPAFVRAAVLARGSTPAAELTLTPLLDLLLAIVLFLLCSFRPPTCQRLAGLPAVANVTAMVDAPFVVVDQNQVTVDGSPAASTRDLLDDGRVTSVGGLFDQLRNKRELWKMLQPGREFPGVLVLRVDGKVPALVVKSVVQTAARAGYPSISFAVRRLELP